MIRWKFWKDTGETFFRIRLDFVINAKALEIAAWRSYRDIKSKKDLIEVVKQELKESGSPVFWGYDETLTDDEIKRARLEAQKIVMKYFPEAYKKVINQ